MRCITMYASPTIRSIATSGKVKEMSEKVITDEQRAEAVNMIAAWRNLKNYHEAVGDTHAVELFSGYCTVGVIVLGDLLGESYATVEQAVSARYDKIYGGRESVSHD